MLKRWLCKTNLIKLLKERSKRNAENRIRGQNEARRQVRDHDGARERSEVNPLFQKIIQELYGKTGFARERII